MRMVNRRLSWYRMRWKWEQARKLNLKYRTWLAIARRGRYGVRKSV